MGTKVTMKGKSGKVYEIKTHPYGINNVELVFVYGGIVVACGVRPLRGNGCDKGLEDILERAEIEAATFMVHVED